MVPFLIEKAKAREDLAGAIVKDSVAQEGLVRLGYDKIALTAAGESADHQTRQAEEEVEMARMAWTRANKATEFARVQARRLLQEYANLVRGEILEKKKALEMDGVDFKLTTSLARQAIGINNEVAVTNHEIANLTAELNSILANMNSRAIDQAETVRDGALRLSKTFTTSNLSRKIVEGFVGYTMGSAQIG